jgi:DNA-directed RNA polymerases I, II, and III subunit RPABC2
MTIEDMSDIMKNYDPNSNKTKNIMTKYEKVKIIGTRAEQLQRGAPPNIPINPDTPFDARLIAHEELRQKKVPFLVRRNLPNGAIEYWRIEDMIIL